MAKGLRASRNKVNNARLRAKVFGPVENARKERLSAKLLELAAKPKPPPPVESTGVNPEGGDEVEKGQEPVVGSTVQTKPQEEEMDLDAAGDVAPTKRSQKSDRIQKRRRQKRQSSMVFPVYKKGRRVGSRSQPRKQAARR